MTNSNFEIAHYYFGANIDMGYSLFEGFLVTKNELLEYALLYRQNKAFDPNQIAGKHGEFIPIVTIPAIDGYKMIFEAKGIFPFFNNHLKPLKGMKQERDRLIAKYPNHQYVEGNYNGISYYSEDYRNRIEMIYVDKVIEVVEQMFCRGEVSYEEKIKLILFTRELINENAKLQQSNEGEALLESIKNLIKRYVVINELDYMYLKQLELFMIGLYYGGPFSNNHPMFKQDTRFSHVFFKDSKVN